ncbi:MAG: hypothetical protein J5486_06585 [Bacteroidaceae bacterium]|nr:hypothetical protein [Bacteroidaceae bacterium]
MKKTYIAPATYAELSELGQMLAASVGDIWGNCGIGLGTGETPTEADVKSDDWDLWDEE